jgi:predicted O-methyltransferase YrrM
MNSVLAEIEKTGMMVLPSGESIKAHSHVGSGSGRVIRHAIEVAKPKVACEVGLAYGVSSLYILDAMQENGGGRLIGMDPAQHDGTWSGGGLHNIQRAGYADRYEFHEDTSQRVLPHLAEAGTRIQFGFIDGWHTFDHTLVDFFYIDQMLDVGGVVVLDDVGYPGLRRLAHFIVSNRDYEILDFDPAPARPSWKSSLKRVLQTILNPLVRDNFTPDERTVALEREVNKAQLIALRKKGHDQRSFDHFVTF